MSQCPFIAKFTPTPALNEPVEYKTADGGIYTFYRHDDGLGEISNVQFCEHIGRKRDVFECLNENEWRCCYAYRSAMRSDFDGFFEPEGDAPVVAGDGMNINDMGL